MSSPPPQPTAPEPLSPELTSPEPMSPEMPTEGLRPEVVSPEATAPEPISPEVLQAKVLSPEAKPPEPMSPEACALKLKTLFPALFVGPPKPLKLRIQADIQARAPGVFTKQSLSGFLRRHTGGHGYLVAITRATHRFDLDGAPGDEITPEHRQAALDELARRRTNQDARRELEAQQRHNRATLLADYERTTLTPANFCALKGIATEELDGFLATARREAEEMRREVPPMAHRDSREGRGGRDERAPGPRQGPRQGQGPRQRQGPRQPGPRQR